MNIIKTKSIELLSIKVSEEINKKFIKEFIHTNILNSNIVINKNTKYFYKYIKFISTYEILVFDSSDTNIVLEPFLFHSYYDDKLDFNTDIFLNNNYFVIYQNNEFLMLKHIENLEKKDILTFINQTYKLKINNIIELNSEKIEGFKNSYKSDKNIKYYTFYTTNSYRYFLLFCFVTTLLFGYLIYEKIDNQTNHKNQIIKQNNDSNTLKIKDIYSDKTKGTIVKMIEFFKYLKINKIDIKKVKYINNTLKTTLYHKEKESLLNLVSMYENKIVIKSIIYDKENQLFTMEVIIEY